ncbi:MULTISPECIES: formate dehydrogenase accessory sulfurtransferase FdhD [unclassified Aureimonas]|uniref:formate dehydrogenase accessory sulfurtransferase FdhD n=1 Tax=unclassified Aureimonas TaxID=2615206 RepID=UPI000700DA42|nr:MULTISPECIES: formate dehydrogenase accessory sulfurtransferase FdhD [unclassified Aureimonas]KQT60697.1 formate dehydrogenase family accessory protein FdhD [Aureimonas sp. Leaf460]KQT68826.1 formate dehydrogenase family accessory protein FdhD [Aureimonas sp. Leaf427]
MDVPVRDEVEDAGEGGARRVPALAFRGQRFILSQRAVPEETAIAVSIDGSTHAVMMATPVHVEELGLGLALAERIVASPAEIERIEVVETEAGLDCQIRLVPERGRTYVARRRQMTGPVGCGLCGVESLELAAPALPVVSAGTVVTPEAISAAVEAMAREQALGRETRAVHAAAFHLFDGGLVVAREDVGRHNALDKVAGYLARNGFDPASGFITITSRVSVELIQKAAIMGSPLIAAVSAPSALAIRMAEASGVTLVAVVRGAEFEIFTHANRIAGAPGADETGYAEAASDAA